MLKSHQLDMNQLKKLIQWDEAHGCSITNEGAIGGRLTYCYTPTGLGVVVIVKCACGEEIDVTDYDSW